VEEEREREPYEAPEVEDLGTLEEMTGSGNMLFGPEVLILKT
jgi:hypothetical protein